MSKKEKLYQRKTGRSLKRSGRIAMTVFIIAAVICEILLFTGLRRDPHPAVYGAMIAIVTAVFVGIGWGIHYITTNLSKPEPKLDFSEVDEDDSAETADEAGAPGADDPEEPVKDEPEETENAKIR